MGFREAGVRWGGVGVDQHGGGGSVLGWVLGSGGQGDSVHGAPDWGVSGCHRPLLSGLWEPLLIHDNTSLGATKLQLIIF